MCVLLVTCFLVGCQSVTKDSQGLGAKKIIFSEFANITGSCYAETGKAIYASRMIVAGMKNEDMLYNLSKLYNEESERNSELLSWVSKRDNSTPLTRLNIYRDAPPRCTERFLTSSNGQEVKLANNCIAYSSLPWLMSAFKNAGASRKDYLPFALYKTPANKYEAEYMVAYNRALNSLTSEAGVKYNPDQESRSMLASCSLWVLQANDK